MDKIAFLKKIKTFERGLSVRGKNYLSIYYFIYSELYKEHIFQDLELALLQFLCISEKLKQKSKKTVYITCWTHD